MSIVKEILIEKIIRINKTYPNIVKSVIDTEINQGVLEKYNRDELVSFERTIDIKVAEKETGFTVNKMRYMIQESTSISEVGLQVLTKFNCKKCGKEEVHGSSAVPILCSSCAEDVAKRLLVKMYRIY